jgi:hypothetical protein
VSAYRAPAALFASVLTGLVLALVFDGVADFVSLALVVLPLLVVAWFIWARRRSVG